MTRIILSYDFVVTDAEAFEEWLDEGYQKRAFVKEERTHKEEEKED